MHGAQTTEADRVYVFIFDECTQGFELIGESLHRASKAFQQRAAAIVATALQDMAIKDDAESLYSEHRGTFPPCRVTAVLPQHATEWPQPRNSPIVIFGFRARRTVP